MFILDGYKFTKSKHPDAWLQERKHNKNRNFGLYNAGKKKYILKIGLTTGYGTLSSCNSDSLRFLFCTVFLKYTKNL